MKALLALATIAFWLWLIGQFLPELLRPLAPLANLLFGLVFCGFLLWGGLRLYKRGYAHTPRKWQYWRGHIAEAVVAALVVASIITASILGVQFVLLGPIALVIVALTAGEALAERGMREWWREQRGEATSGVHGKARFVVFDADLDQRLFSKLEQPVGSGALLGFYDAYLLPSFFHRLSAWQANWREVWKNGLQLSRYHHLVYGGDSHLLTIAPARSGKGNSVIIPNLLTLKRSVICIDPKGQNAADTKRHRATLGPVYLLNPFNEHGMGTARYNPLAALDIQSPNVVADAAGLAEALIVPEGKEPFFTDSARDLVQAIILHLVATKGTAATLPEMRRMLSLPSGEGENDKFGLLIFEMMQSAHPFVAQPASRFKNVDKTTLSIISTAIAQTRFLDDPAIIRVLEGNDFHMKEFKERIQSLYIILPSRYLTAYARFFRLVVVSALDQLTAVPGGQRVTMILDEFAQLGHLSAIETAFGLAAGYNVQLWPFLQDLNQLKDIYKTRWETFLANAGVVQWFAPNDMTTAEYLSKRLGNRTVSTLSTTSGNWWAKLNAGFGPSRTQSETGVPLQSPQDLIAMDANLPRDAKVTFNPDQVFDDIRAQILNVAGIEHPIRCLRAPYYSDIYSMAGELGDEPKWKNLKGFKDEEGKDTFDKDPFHD